MFLTKYLAAAKCRFWRRIKWKRENKPMINLIKAASYCTWQYWFVFKLFLEHNLFFIKSSSFTLVFNPTDEMKPSVNRSQNWLWGDKNKNWRTLTVVCSVYRGDHTGVQIFLIRCVLSSLLQVIRILKELKQKYPDKELDQLVELANYYALLHQQKSRAFYRIQVAHTRTHTHIIPK